MPKPVKTPPKAADWRSTKTYWEAVEPVGKSKPGTLPTAESPPAKEAKKKSGKISAGISSALLVRKLWTLRQEAARRRQHAQRADPQRDAEAECDLARLPAFDQQRAERLQQVGDRVDRGDG